MTVMAETGSTVSSNQTASGARRPRAVVLLSGGLDSTLAAKLLQEQGVEIIGVHFSTGFCVTDHKRATARGNEDPKKLRNEALRAGADLGVPVELIDISSEYLDIVFNPKHGYGAHMNPCIDCRAFMLGKAKALMEERDADFVATGEVLGQRPMSQRRDTMRLVERDSGLQDKLLRPLSALRLKPTEPEKSGLIDRSKLLGLTGRGRRAQMDLIEAKGITDYPLPAGGCCFLTDANYARKFKDKMAHRTQGRMSWEDVTLLKLGRHFRVTPKLKLIVGRKEEENDFLERFAKTRVRLEAVEINGPVGLTDESLPSPEEERLCASILARYTDGKGQVSVPVKAEGGSCEGRLHDVTPLWDETVLGPMRL